MPPESPRPAVVVRFAIEAAPQVSTEHLGDADRSRVHDWLANHPDYLELILDAADLARRDCPCACPDCAPFEMETLLTPAAPARDAADAAGRFTIPSGKHAGKTIAQVAQEPRGASWIRWAILATDHPATPHAKAYARVYLPDTFAEAMHELGAGRQ